MSVYCCFEKYGIINSNLNNKLSPGIYLCELARTISVVNLNESQIYPKFEYAYLLQKGASRAKPLALGYDGADFSHKESILNNRRKSGNCFSSQRNLLLVDFPDVVKRLLFQRNIHVPKNFETFEKMVFEVKTGSQISSQHKIELVSLNYPIKNQEKLTESISAYPSHNVILKNENPTVEPLIFFENKFQKVFKLDNPIFDLRVIVGGAKPLIFNNYADLLGKPISINSYQTKSYRKKVSFNEFIEINTEGLHESTNQKNYTEIILTKSFETSTWKKFENPMKANEGVENDSQNGSIVNTLLEEISVIKCPSDLSSDYETCSSIRLKRKNCPFLVSKTIMAKCNNEKSRNPYLSENVEISIPIPKMNKGFHIESSNKNLTVSISTNRKKSHPKSINLDLGSIESSISSISEDISSIERIPDDILIQKPLIEKLLGQTRNLPVESYKQINLRIRAINSRVNLHRFHQIFDIFNATWKGMKDLSIFLFGVGASLFNCTASSLTRAIFQFYYNGNISYLT